MVYGNKINQAQVWPEASYHRSTWQHSTVAQQTCGQE